jgi:hypothetical protein
MALLATGVVLTAAALPAPAHARTRPHTPQKLSVTKQLRLQLHKTRALLAQARADASQLKGTLAQTTATLTQTQATLAQTQATLTQTKAELVSSQANAASLQSKLNAIPTPLVAAEEQVRREVAYEEQQALPYPQGRLVAQAAMDYVSGHVSASAYGFLSVTHGVLPVATPDSVLGAQAGICGHAALTFAAIVQHFGYQVRSVQFYYDDPPPYSTPDSHIANEVYYEGGWHFFDPTFGVLWFDKATGSVLSITDARAGLGTRSKDEATFTNLAEDFFYGDGTSFETDPATSVVLDGQPF